MALLASSPLDELVMGRNQFLMPHKPVDRYTFFTTLALTPVRAAIGQAMALLGPIRQAQMALAENAAAESRARLKDHEPKIMADPLLRGLYALLKRPQAADAMAREVNGG